MHRYDGGALTLFYGLGSFNSNLGLLGGETLLGKPLLEGMHTEPGTTNT